MSANMRACATGEIATGIESACTDGNCWFEDPKGTVTWVTVLCDFGDVPERSQAAFNSKKLVEGLSSIQLAASRLAILLISP